MSKTIEHAEENFPKLDQESVQNRRRFMKRTLSLTAVFAAAGLSESVLEAALMNDAEAADLTIQKGATELKGVQRRAVVAGAGSERDFANALSLAAHDGNAKKSLQRFGPKLSLQQQRVLKSLSANDLRTLMALKRKLGGGSAKCCDAGATIF